LVWLVNVGILGNVKKPIIINIDIYNFLSIIGIISIIRPKGPAICKLACGTDFPWLPWP
jgi:hypothetical protein